ncbi:MAG: hypothetical protein MJ213_04485 [Bacilli bacterium]|nr:hypothetical protein [Bacilli bacterium]
MDEEFKQFVKTLSDLALANKDKEEPDVVTDRDAIIAYYIISHINIIEEGDALLFLVANNLINAYIKQPGALDFFGYEFKNSLCVLLYYGMQRDLPNLKINYIPKELDGNNVIMFNIYDLQFSFHCIPKRMRNCILARNKADLRFNGVRNKNCINELFKRTLDNRLFFNDCTVEQTSLLEGANNLADDYLNGKINRKHLKDICYLPNYCFDHTGSTLGVGPLTDVAKAIDASDRSGELRQKWNAFYLEHKEKATLDEYKGKCCLVSAELLLYEEDIDALISFIKEKGYIAVRNLEFADNVIVKDLSDKNRLLAKYKDKYNFEYIVLS